VDGDGQVYTAGRRGPNPTDILVLKFREEAALAFMALDPEVLSNSCIKGKNAPAQTFSIWNSGLGSLNYSINDNAAWLSCSPNVGSSTGEHDTITVTYASSTLAAGTYKATITVTGPEATNTPRQIQVTLKVSGALPWLSPSLD
jgi:hypothetical protein